MSDRNRGPASRSDMPVKSQRASFIAKRQASCDGDNMPKKTGRTHTSSPKILKTCTAAPTVIPSARMHRRARWHDELAGPLMHRCKRAFGFSKKKTAGHPYESNEPATGKMRSEANCRKCLSEDREMSLRAWPLVRVLLPKPYGQRTRNTNTAGATQTSRGLAQEGCEMMRTWSRRHFPIPQCGRDRPASAVRPCQRHMVTEGVMTARRARLRSRRSSASFATSATARRIAHPRIERTPEQLPQSARVIPGHFTPAAPQELRRIDCRAEAPLSHACCATSLELSAKVGKGEMKWP